MTMRPENVSSTVDHYTSSNQIPASQKKELFVFRITQVEEMTDDGSSKLTRVLGELDPIKVRVESDTATLH